MSPRPSPDLSMFFFSKADEDDGGLGLNPTTQAAWEAVRGKVIRPSTPPQLGNEQLRLQLEEEHRAMQLPWPPQHVLEARIHEEMRQAEDPPPCTFFSQQQNVSIDITDQIKVPIAGTAAETGGSTSSLEQVGKAEASLAHADASEKEDKAVIAPEEADDAQTGKASDNLARKTTAG